MLVSVLLPVFNAERTLAIALESVRRQRDVDLECVAVDDGSSDGSLACLERAARADPRIRVIACEHRGIVDTLNQGLQACRGQLVARMDADDIMCSGRLSAQLELLRARPELSGVGCHVRLFPRSSSAPGPGSTSLAGRRDYERWLNSLQHEEHVARDRFVECPLAHPSWMLRGDVFREYGYREMGWPEDYDLLLRLHCAGHRLGVVPQRLLAWRDSPGRLSRQDERYTARRFVAAKAHFLAQDWLREQPRYILWGYGDTGRALSKALGEHGRQPHAIVEVHPRRIGQCIMGAPVVAPAQLPALREAAGGLPIIVSVAHAGPRQQVRQTLAALQLRELVDFVCAA
ncbi:MAG: hypothetical protein RL685_729 [Pseudomonadota bacterium]|jgi:glycosyltransferase involved in cell wall biosynthesis